MEQSLYSWLESADCPILEVAGSIGKSIHFPEQCLVESLPVLL